MFEAKVGDDVDVVCTTTSTEPVIWYNQSSNKQHAGIICHNGIVLEGLEYKFRLANTRSRSHLTIIDTQSQDNGQYSCKESSEKDSMDSMTLKVAGTAAIP